MIRLGQPVPTLLRLRLRAHVAASQVARQTQSFKTGVITTVHKDLDVLRRASHIVPRRTGAVLREAADNPAVFQAFKERYDCLVDLLCWAAKERVPSEQDEGYADIRMWLIEHYEMVRPALLSHLATDPSDTQPGADGEPAPRDAFESLFLPASLDSIIHSDTVIDRIIRTRAALDACWN